MKEIDLYSGAAMIIADLMVSGTTTIEQIEYIERGYENIINKLTALGVYIKESVCKKEKWLKPYRDNMF